jgi:hypothetical protein
MTENYEKKELTKSEKMEELRKQLAELETEHPKEESSDDEVEVKPKKERTEKQKLAFEKAQQTRLLKAEERRKERMKQEEETKKELEQKLIEKAIKVKKKQIKKIKAIEELSDDDTPIERVSRRIEKRPEPVITKLRFV